MNALHRLCAGPVSKYGSFYRSSWLQKMNDSREVGEQLAYVMLPLFDPTTSAPRYEDDGKVVKFMSPKKIQVSLPGNLYYLESAEPALVGEEQASPHRNLVIENKRHGHFTISIDSSGIIKRLLYLGDSSIPSENLLSLYGHHEKYYNRLIARFEEGIISDFIDYFNEPWALALFHDRFDTFIEELTNSITGTTQNPVKEINDLLLEISAKQSELATEHIEEVYSAFDKACCRAKWDQEIFGYLTKTGIFGKYA